LKTDEHAVPASELSLVHLLSHGEVAERVKAFHHAVQLVAPGELLLVEGAALLEDRIAMGPPLGEPGDPPTVLLDADRWEVTGILERLPIAAAIEKYALFMWWNHREKALPGAFWIHGETRIAVALGADIVLSPLYRNGAHCAFGSSSSAGLPALLARYVAAWARDRAAC
jgi:hypothetical protein